jgi:hypothetical protein
MKKFLVIGAATLALTAHVAEAQRGSHRGSGQIELGIDGGISFGLDNPNVTVVSLPLQDFRFGYFLNDRVEIEPRFSINSVHTDAGSITTYDFEAGLLLQPGGDRVGKGLYIRPLVGISGVNATGANGNSSGYLGAGFGLKLPFADRRMATRMEANYSHGFSNGGSNVIGVSIGLSFFTR